MGHAPRSLLALPPSSVAQSRCLATALPQRNMVPKLPHAARLTKGQHRPGKRIFDICRAWLQGNGVFIIRLRFSSCSVGRRMGLLDMFIYYLGALVALFRRHMAGALLFRIDSFLFQRAIALSRQMGSSSD